MSTTTVRVLRSLTIAVLGAASLAHALPVELKDSNGTRYHINTDVYPFTNNNSLASGAVTDATFLGPITVTDTWVRFTFWGGTSTFTTQHEVNVNLRPAFAGFNGLTIISLNGLNLPTPLVYNPGVPLAGDECPQNGSNRQLVFPTQTFEPLTLSVTRKVFVPSNDEWVRWLNVITNTGQSAVQVGISLRGLIASGSQTKITATSTGDSVLSAADQWFTSAQEVPQDVVSLQPRIGYVLQGPNAPVPATTVGINNAGQAAFVYTPTIQPGQTIILMTFVTVQGKTKNAKSECTDLVATPLPSHAIQCMSELELAQVANFQKLTPPTLKSATVKLKFSKTAQDTVQWKGSVAVGAGISLVDQPVTVNFGGVSQSFLLSKSGAANNGGGNKFNLQAKLQNGVTKAGNFKFSFNLKGDLQDALAGDGLTDVDAKNLPVSIPLTISVGTAGAEYAVDQPFSYTATQGKTGTATAPPQ